MTTVLKRPIPDAEEHVAFTPHKRGTLSSCVRHDGGMELDCHGAGKEHASRGSLTLSEHREVPSKVPGVPGGMGALSQPSTFRTVEQNAWLAVEELNAMFQAHPDLFQHTPLLSYHSFTRTTKPSVFSKMCSVHSVSAEDVVKGAVAGPLHLRLVLHVLQNVYQGYSDASIVLSSFHTPEWMKLWCNKWGFSASRRSMTSIYTVNAFPEPDTETRADRQLPVRTMLVPSFSPNFR